MRLWSGAKEGFEAAREPGQIDLATLAKQFGRVRIGHGERCEVLDKHRQTSREADNSVNTESLVNLHTGAQAHKLRNALVSGLHSRRFPAPPHVPTKPKKRQVVTWMGWLAENTRQISEPHPLDSAYIPRPGRIGLSSLMS